MSGSDETADSPNTTQAIRYLSDEWFAEADRAVSSLSPVDGKLVVGFYVAVDETTSVAYRAELGPGPVAIRDGIGDAPVVFNLDWELAAGIANGAISPQRAFLDGQLTLAGDAGQLLGFQQSLAAFDDQLATLRHRTDYSRPDANPGDAASSVEE